MRDPHLAAWLHANRSQIDRTLAARLGAAAPRPAADETEVLRRFRSFAAAALQRGEPAQPALDGLRVNERRVAALLDAWSDAACEVAGESGDRLKRSLKPLLMHFYAALRTMGSSRRKRGAPRARRRAVVAAIDRVADLFLAIDANSGHVVDANPAAGAMLGVARDALMGVDAMSFVPKEYHAFWWTELDSVTENSEPRRFRGELRDAQGAPVRVDCSITRFTTRERCVALVVARPL